jgi:hypothetical protein
MNHAARFLVLISLGACGDDGANSVFSSGIDDRDKPAATLDDKEKEQFCSTVETHVSVTVGLEEVMRIACAPIALLTSTSREACEELLDSCAKDAPKIMLERQQREQECFDSLAECEADVSTLEGCVDVNVRALRTVLERISCARFGDSSVQDDIDEARTAAACAQAANSCRDAVLLY